MRQFYLFTYPPRSKWASFESIFCKSISDPFSEAKTYLMVHWLQLLNQLEVVWRETKVFTQNLAQWCLRKIQLLRTTVNWFWWHFTHTFCHSSNILWSRLLRLVFLAFQALVYRCGFPFISLFSYKVMNIRSWRWFSSSKMRTQFSQTFFNITMVFKLMSQYFLALFTRIHNHIRSVEG